MFPDTRTDFYQMSITLAGSRQLSCPVIAKQISKVRHAHYQHVLRNHYLSLLL